MGWQHYLAHMAKCQWCGQPFYMLTYAKMLPCLHYLCCDQCIARYSQVTCPQCGYSFSSVTNDPALEALQKDISEFYYGELSEKEKEDRAYAATYQLSQRLRYLATARHSAVDTERGSATTQQDSGYTRYQYEQDIASAYQPVQEQEEVKTYLYQPLLSQNSGELNPDLQRNPLSVSQAAPPPLEGLMLANLSQVPMSELGQPLQGLWACRYCGCGGNQGTRCKNCRRVNLGGLEDPLPKSVQETLYPKEEEDASCCPCIACSIF